MRIETRDESVLESPLTDACSERVVVGKAFLGVEILDELYALEKSLTSDVADDGVLLCESLEAGA